MSSSTNSYTLNVFSASYTAYSVVIDPSITSYTKHYGFGYDNNSSEGIRYGRMINDGKTIQWYNTNEYFPGNQLNGPNIEYRWMAVSLN